MNRTIKDATVKRYFYETHAQLRAHLRDFVDAYNFARRLKTLKGLTPYEFVCKAWTSEPKRLTPRVLCLWVESVCLRLAAGHYGGPRSIHLGFLGPWPLRRKTPRLCGLDLP
jgi:hypothetical protein